MIGTFTLSFLFTMLVNIAMPSDDRIAGTHAVTRTAPTTDTRSYGTLAGTVSAKDGAAINGAAIEIAETSPKLGSYSRADGSYKVRRLKPGRYAVIATAPAYKEHRYTVEIGGGTAATLNITLDPAPERREKSKMLSGKSVATRSYAKMEFADMDGAGSVSEGLVATAPPPPPAPSTSAPAGGEERGAARADDAKVVDGTMKPVDRAEPIGDTSTAPPKVVQRPGQLTAGEWSDLLHWSYWSDVVTSNDWKGMLTRWGFDPSSRVVVRVFDRTKPVIDAEVRLVNAQGTVLWNARTDNSGTAELFAGIAGKVEGGRIQVRRGSEFVDAAAATQGAPVMVSMPGASVARDEFDMAFMIDATGSMGDEMEYLKSELQDVIERAREASTDDLSIRLSCNVYRDHGDEYVVRTFPFSESTFEMIGNLRNQYAGGGGDFEEAMEEGLEAAIDKLEWRPQARARLLFLVLDAPPHYTPDRLEKVRKLAAKAAAKGIRIIPLAASGINKETEFLLRPLAIYTGGTYLFLTDDSGIGESHVKPSIGRYDVEDLNNLMVKVIARYLATEQLAVDNGNGLDLH